MSLQLDYLCTLRSASDIKHRLGRLPKSLETSYAELIEQNVKNYEPEDRQRLSLILSLLLVSSKPVAPVFAAFVFWEPREEDDSDDYADTDTEEEEQPGENVNVVGNEAIAAKYRRNISGQMTQVLGLCFKYVFHPKTNYLSLVKGRPHPQLRPHYKASPVWGLSHLYKLKESR